VPLTDALLHALRDHRHLRGEHVLFGNDALPATGFFLRNLLEAGQKRAGLRSTGGLHILRHTFCSHLAMGAHEYDRKHSRGRRPQRHGQRA
jgi:integrase